MGLPMALRLLELPCRVPCLHRRRVRRYNTCRLIYRGGVRRVGILYWVSFGVQMGIVYYCFLHEMEGRNVVLVTVYSGIRLRASS